MFESVESFIWTSRGKLAPELRSECPSRRKVRVLKIFKKSTDLAPSIIFIRRISPDNSFLKVNTIFFQIILISWHILVWINSTSVNFLKVFIDGSFFKSILDKLVPINSFLRNLSRSGILIDAQMGSFENWRVNC